MRASLPDVGSRFGAPMGRADTLPDGFRGFVQCARVYIDRGGYDAGGAYWGLGPPLYQARGIVEGGREAGFGYFRAADSRAAETKARQLWPAAKVS